MTGAHDEGTTVRATGVRICHVGIALAALGCAAYVGTAGLALLNDANGPALLREHVPALLGSPILISLSIAIVCGARALDAEFRIEFLGLLTAGAGAVVLSWVVVFVTIAIALRALW